METTPKNGDESESAVPKPNETARSRKSRPPVEIDLPAESVSEVKPDPAPASAAEMPAGEAPASGATAPEPGTTSGATAPEPATASGEMGPAQPAASAPRPALGLPVLVALVAGVAASLGVQALLGRPDSRLAGTIEQRLSQLEQTRPAPVLPPDLAERLARAEKSLAEAGPREQALQAEIARLSASLTSLSERPATPAGGAGTVDTAAFDRLRQATEGQVARIAALGDQLTALSKAVAGAGGELARASATVVTSQMLAENFQRGEALGGPIEALRALGVANEQMAPLAPFAQNPAPSLASLGTELRELAKASAEASAGPEADLVTRLRQGLSSLVEVRRTGEITGTDDAAHLARAEQAVARGDLATAITLVGRLSSPRAERFAAWKARTEARAKAEAAIRQIRQDGLAALARAAGTARP